MERYDFRTQRLFVEADLSAGSAIPASREQSNYLLNVLRMREGSPVLLFNGRDGEWLASIGPKGRKECLLVCGRQTRPQPSASHLRYLFAPLKQARLDYMVQKAVEMGTGILQPVITQHTQVARINPDRMQANAIEAAEQCGILSIPVIREPEKLDRLIANWDEETALIFCDESAGSDDPLQSLAKLRGRQAAVLIGPEGGFSAVERELLRQQPFVTPIGLGPRILRADTAAVAALALVQAAIGDWREDGS